MTDLTPEEMAILINEIERNKQRSKEDVILRQAARILLDRPDNVAKIRMAPKTTLFATLNVTFTHS